MRTTLLAVVALSTIACAAPEETAEGAPPPARKPSTSLVGSYERGDAVLEIVEHEDEREVAYVLRTGTVRIEGFAATNPGDARLSDDRRRVRPDVPQCLVIFEPKGSAGIVVETSDCEAELGPAPIDGTYEKKRTR